MPKFLYQTQVVTLLASFPSEIAQGHGPHLLYASVRYRLARQELRAEETVKIK